MTPKLLFTLICDDARIEKSNKLIIIGLYNYVINFGIPQPQRHPTLPGNIVSEQPRLQFAIPQLCLVRRWYVDSAGHKVHTELIGPEGKVHARVDTELALPPTDNYSQEVVQFAGVILIPGEYKIVTKFDNLEHTEHFVVRVT